MLLQLHWATECSGLLSMLCRETPAQPISVAGPSSMPAASPEDNLPFLLDEDPSRGSSRHGSQAGSSVHGAPAAPLPQQPQLAQQLRQEPHSLQPRRAWSVDPQPGLQVWRSRTSMTSTRPPLEPHAFQPTTLKAEHAAHNLPGPMLDGARSLPTHQLTVQAQQPYGFSPDQGQPTRAPAVSERLHSMGTQHAPKQPASNPFLISLGGSLPRPAHVCCLGCRYLGRRAWRLYATVISKVAGKWAEWPACAWPLHGCCSVRAPACCLPGK